MITNIVDVIFVGSKLLELFMQSETRIPNTLLSKRNFDCMSAITMYKNKNHVTHAHFVNEFKKLLTKYNIPIKDD